MQTEPAQVFHPAEYLGDELKARGWEVADLAIEMPGDPGLNHLILDFMFAALDAPHDHAIQDATMGKTTAYAIAAALDTSPDVWLNLQESWNKWPDKRCWPTEDAGQTGE